MMRCASCFSGIGGAELALPEGVWLWSAEVDPFANAVRSCHFPGVPNLGDVLAEDFLATASSYGPLNVLIGGPPCQDFSVAGLRAGLDGTRGNLTLRWVQIIHALRPAFALTENVPGWLSVNGGHAFGAFLAGLVGHDTALLPPANCGGRWTDAGMVAGPDGRAAWRTLDAQFFGLAQRRRRVFVVFCPGERDDPASVLLEPASLRWHPPPRREAREGIAAALTRGADSSDKGGYAGRRREDDDNLIAATLTGGSDTGRNHGKRSGSDRDTLIANPIGAKWRGDLDNDTSGPTDIATAVNAHGGPHGRLDFESETFVTAFDQQGIVRQTLYAGEESAEVSLDRRLGVSTVRRLTPRLRECEALQGYPPGWTDIEYRGKRAADGPRYRALGNAFPVPVVRWIARRIASNG